MLKKILIFLFLLALFTPAGIVSAKDYTSAKDAESVVNIYFFWGEGCPHCAKEKPFLEKMAQKYSEVRIHEYEVWGSSANRQMMTEFGEKLNVKVNGVPFTVIGEKHVIGWMDENYTGSQIEDAIRCSIQNTCRDIGDEVLVKSSVTGMPDEKQVNQKNSPVPDFMTLPIIGEIRTKNLSLPVLTIILGALDGFNPCAMWTLLFLISLLVGMQNKKRMWMLGSAFIVASAIVYFLFMVAWLNLLVFLGFIVWIRIVIGLVALGGGGYNLKEYFSNKDATCKVTNTEKRQRIFQKIKDITHQQNFYLALIGIIILAFAVNLVELLCSAGLPVVFTQILTLSGLSSWQYYLYILFYIFIFLLDDLFVFVVAMTTLQVTGMTTKYTRLSHLIGGVLMLIIGLLMIFKPEYLMFG